MDAVLSFHMNGLTCGVAKFNHRLGRELGVPVCQIFEDAAQGFREPLLSLKISEFQPLDIDHLDRLLDSAPWGVRYRLFLHAWSGTAIERRLVAGARQVYCANSELAAQMADMRPDAHSLFCPGTLEDAREFNHADLTVFTFGMAHKIRARHYDRLKELLDATGLRYSLYLSTALHENTSFDEEFSIAFEELQAIFGEKVFFFGYLSDGAVYNQLKHASFFAAFFDHGVRANNTSVNAAMQSGTVVITNLDEHSPPELVPMENVVDINRCDVLPVDERELERISANAERLVAERYGWEALVRRLRPSTGAEPEALSAVARAGRTVGEV